MQDCVITHHNIFVDHLKTTFALRFNVPGWPGGLSVIEADNITSNPELTYLFFKALEFMRSVSQVWVSYTFWSTYVPHYIHYNKHADAHRINPLQMLTTRYQLPAADVPFSFDQCAAYLAAKAEEKDGVSAQMIEELYAAGYSNNHDLPVTKADWKSLMLSLAKKAR